MVAPYLAQGRRFTVMTGFLPFLFFLSAGVVAARYCGTVRLAELVKRVSVAVLLLFILLMFGEMDFPRNNLLMVLAGALMQAVPAMIGMHLSKADHSADFLLFSTYGGGNRGTLAVTLLMPSLLPDFMLLDLGNLVALLLLFRISARRFAGAGQGGGKSLLLTVAAIGAGIALRQTWGPSAPLHHAFTLIKVVLVAVTSFQIGLSLRLDIRALGGVVAGWARVRPLAAVAPLLFLLAVNPGGVGRYGPLLALFALLPVSSLAASLLPRDADVTLREKLSNALVGGTLLYSLLLGAVLATTHLLGWETLIP